MKKIGLLDVKKALKDTRFRQLLPPDFQKTYEKELIKFISEPGCACNVPLYRAILRECKTQIEQYYPGREATNEDEDIKQLSKNNFTVINCHIDELENRLRKMPNGRKQIAMSRYENEVTVIVNELDVLFS